MNHYETVFIMNPVLSEDQVKETVKKFVDYIKKAKGEVTNEESWGLKKLKYIQSFLKKTFTCTIEDFSKKLIYVNINDVDFTAFIYRSHLKQDRYRIARSKHAIVGQYTKKTYRVGDSLKTSVENIDMINVNEEITFFGIES